MRALECASARMVVRIYGHSSVHLPEWSSVDGIPVGVWVQVVGKRIIVYMRQGMSPSLLDGSLGSRMLSEVLAELGDACMAVRRLLEADETRSAGVLMFYPQAV